MSHCYDDGALRAYIDDALPAAERTTLTLHLAACAMCQRRLRAIEHVATRTAALLAAPAPVVDARAAFARLTTDDRRPQHTPVEASSIKYQVSSIKYQVSRRKTMSTKSLSRRLIGAVATLVVAVALLALPPVRALADQVLQVFRVQNVMFVPVSRDRMEQLKNLNFDKDTLFVAKPNVVNTPAAPRTVASAQEASSVVGFAVAEPTNFPAALSQTEFTVLDRRVMETQVNVESARQLLKLMQVDDVTLPDALGAKPIQADVPPSVATQYSAPGFKVELMQGRSPSVTLPDGVDMAQLGKAALRLLGTPADQAETMSQQIDWSSTFLVPIPSDISNVREVTVNGAKGMLVTGRGQERGTMIYWQQGERFFVLRGEGVSDTALVQMAESVR